MGTKEVLRLPELKWGKSIVGSISHAGWNFDFRLDGGRRGMREGGVKGSPGGRVGCRRRRIFLMLGRRVAASRVGGDAL